MDPYTYMGLIRNDDASITRKPNHFPATAASTDQSNPVLTKDVTINHETNTWARLYLPSSASVSSGAAKLPVIVYYHGGGFVLCSAASSMFHNFLSGIALNLPAVIVSVDYRLAPEHRLPAAYDDCAEALHWLNHKADDEWLSKYADLSNCYVMGTSAGGNIAYHVGLRLAAEVGARVVIRGLILHHPFFGGAERMPSEIRLADDAVLPRHVTDLMWDLALPAGVDRDHHYCNPMKEERDLEGMVEKMKGKGEGWKILMSGCDGDPTVDRQMELAGMMREKGLNVVQEFSTEGFHGIQLFDDSKAKLFFRILNNFVFNSNPPV